MTDSDYGEDRFNELFSFAPDINLNLKANIMSIEHLADRAQVAKDNPVVKTLVGKLLTSTEKNTIRANPNVIVDDYTKYIRDTLSIIKDRKMHQSKGPYAVSSVKCFRCGKHGHSSTNCTMDPLVAAPSVASKRSTSSGAATGSSGSATGSGGSYTAGMNKDATNASPKKKLADIICYNCKESGHYSRQCPVLSSVVSIKMNRVADNIIKELERENDMQGSESDGEF